MRTTKATTVAEYIAEFPKSTQQHLKEIRKVIKETAPDAVEAISYGMPGYKLLGKPLVYFGGYEHHIGFYGTPSTHTAFQKDLSKYKQGKGSVQFPIDEPMPLELIRRMVKDRVKTLKGIVKTNSKSSSSA